MPSPLENPLSRFLWRLGLSGATKSPNEQREHGSSDADKLLRNILRRALRKAGLPPVRFHDLRHLAGTLMSEAAVPPKRAQEILGHADVPVWHSVCLRLRKRCRILGALKPKRKRRAGPCWGMRSRRQGIGSAYPLSGAQRVPRPSPCVPPDMSHVSDTLWFAAALLLLAWRLTLLLWIVFTLGLTALFARLFRPAGYLLMTTGAAAAAVMTYGCMVALVLFGDPKM